LLLYSAALLTSEFRRLDDMRNIRTLAVAVTLMTTAFGSASYADEAPRQSLDALRAAAEQFVRTQLGTRSAVQPDATRLKVAIGTLDERLRLAACRSAPLAALPDGAAFAARMTIGIRCVDPAWTVYVPVSVQSETQVLVATHALARNLTPGATDVESQTRWVPGFAHLYVTDLKALAGRHLRIPIAQGNALTVDMLAADVLVKRGQRVTLLASAGGFEVRAQGEALADSGAGGRVRVQNLASHQVVEGVAESATLVRVN
jgi:flagellar basal body P-ring formation protein FlgA